MRVRLVVEHIIPFSESESAGPRTMADDRSQVDAMLHEVPEDQAALSQLFGLAGGKDSSIQDLFDVIQNNPLAQATVQANAWLRPMLHRSGRNALRNLASDLFTENELALCWAKYRPDTRAPDHETRGVLIQIFHNLQSRYPAVQTTGALLAALRKEFNQGGDIYEQCSSNQWLLQVLVRPVRTSVVGPAGEDPATFETFEELLALEHEVDTKEVNDGAEIEEKEHTLAVGDNEVAATHVPASDTPVGARRKKRVGARPRSAPSRRLDGVQIPGSAESNLGGRIAAGTGVAAARAARAASKFGSRRRVRPRPTSAGPRRRSLVKSASATAKLSSAIRLPSTAFKDVKKNATGTALTAAVPTWETVEGGTSRKRGLPPRGAARISSREHLKRAANKEKTERAKLLLEMQREQDRSESETVARMEDATKMAKVLKTGRSYNATFVHSEKQKLVVDRN